MSTKINRRALLETVGLQGAFVGKEAVVRAFFGTTLSPDDNHGPDHIFGAQNVSQFQFPIWNDLYGSIYLEDTIGNKTAMSWSPTGYAIVVNGITIEKFGAL